MDLELLNQGGCGVLAENQEDPGLRHIPVVIADDLHGVQDILTTYDYHGSCYFTRPVDLEQFMDVVKPIEDFWFTIVKLPPDGLT